MKPKRLTKAETIEYWKGLEDADFIDTVNAIPYKAEGSKYGYDGIRIDGSRKFIDSVLAKLKRMLVWESAVTRLELNYTQIVDKVTGEPIDSWVCYIRVHQRGIEGAMAQGVFGSKDIKSNTELLLKRYGI